MKRPVALDTIDLPFRKCSHWLQRLGAAQASCHTGCWQLICRMQLLCGTSMPTTPAQQLGTTDQVPPEHLVLGEDSGCPGMSSTRQGMSWKCVCTVVQTHLSWKNTSTHSTEHLGGGAAARRYPHLWANVPREVAPLQRDLHPYFRSQQSLFPA